MQTVLHQTWLTQIPIAHRGLHDDTKPENSLSAFQAAINAGYAIELDLHLLKDQVLAVLHDFNTLRMTGKDAKIEELSSDQLPQYRFINSSDSIPTFAQVLQLVKGRVPLLIEMKQSQQNEVAADILIDLLHHYRKECGGEYVVESFDPQFLFVLKQKAPEIIRGQLACLDSGQSDKEINKKLAICSYNDLTNPQFIAYSITDMPLEFLNQARVNGMVILGWTVRTPEQLMQAKQYCDNVIFEKIRV
ncbi:MAG TPA: glycerophosphodiester phosphodiesterase family protein [Bacillota bacterium]|nr:glycerophosphodiester phosphodiesterase family protein [Bacillota bacterium]